MKEIHHVIVRHGGAFCADNLLKDSIVSVQMKAELMMNDCVTRWNGLRWRSLTDRPVMHFTLDYNEPCGQMDRNPHWSDILAAGFYCVHLKLGHALFVLEGLHFTDEMPRKKDVP